MVSQAKKMTAEKVVVLVYRRRPWSMEAVSAALMEIILLPISTRGEGASARITTFGATDSCNACVTVE
jgi:hypothetical protein